MIETPDDKLETGLPDEFLANPAEEDIPRVQPAIDVSWLTVTFVFLPHQMSEFETLRERLQGRQDLLGAVPEDQFKAFAGALSKFSSIRDIRNVGTAVTILTRIALSEIAKAEAEETEGE